MHLYVINPREHDFVDILNYSIIKDVSTEGTGTVWPSISFGTHSREGFHQRVLPPLYLHQRIPEGQQDQDDGFYQLKDTVAFCSDVSFVHNN